MSYTRIEATIRLINKYLITLNDDLKNLSLNLISLLMGFFIATVISTIPAQTGDWGLVAGAFIVASQELISKIIYQNILIFHINKEPFKYCNSIKIGIIYGLFVDAFKLGS